MANLNKVMLIGRLTRDVETRTFSTGGKVSKFGFAVNNFKKNMQTGQREEEPVFIDVEAFNRGDSFKLADTMEQYFGPGKGKGRQIYIEGHLKLDQWDDKTTGQKRQRLLVIMDNFQFLDGKPEGEGGGYRNTSAPASRPAAPPPMEGGDHGYDEGPGVAVPPAGGQEEEIPF